MRVLFISLVWTGLAFSQVGPGPGGGGGVLHVTTNPTGSCTATATLRYNTTTGQLSGCNNGTWGLIGGSSGTVTTVGFTGGLLSVANPTTTPAFTVAGTSGGVPYFASASTWASSAAGTVNHVMGWGGAGNAPVDLGVLPTVTGGTCTNQVATAISGSAVPTCTTVTSAYVDSSIAPTNSPTLTTPKIAQINDVNGNAEIINVGTASAVDQLTVTNAATGGAVAIAATGTDTNINLNLSAKGASSNVNIFAQGSTLANFGGSAPQGGVRFNTGFVSMSGYTFQTASGFLSLSTTSADCATNGAHCQDLRLRHAVASGTAPTIASGGGGTGAAIAGADQSGVVTVGTSISTGAVVVAFGTAIPLGLFDCHATDQTNSVSTVADCTTLPYAGVGSGTYTSGITATGTATQTCTLTITGGGGTGATATVALTGTNAIAGGTVLVITAAGSGFVSQPTGASITNGTATCSGTAVIASVLSTTGLAITGYSRTTGLAALFTASDVLTWGVGWAH